MFTDEARSKLCVDRVLLCTRSATDSNDRVPRHSHCVAVFSLIGVPGVRHDGVERQNDVATSLVHCDALSSLEKQANHRNDGKRVEKHLQRSKCENLALHPGVQPQLHPR